MWTVAEIFATKAPRNLYRTEAEHLLKIIEDFKVSEVNKISYTCQNLNILLVLYNHFILFILISFSAIQNGTR